MTRNKSKFKKRVGIAIKSKEKSSKLAIQLIIQTHFQLGRYIHVCINETHSSKSTKFNPYFGRYNYKQHNPVKVGIKSCEFARHFAYMDVPT